MHVSYIPKPTGFVTVYTLVFQTNVINATDLATLPENVEWIKIDVTNVISWGTLPKNVKKTSIQVRNLFILCEFLKLHKLCLSLHLTVKCSRFCIVSP